jgi:hypothetical protein
MVGSSNYWFSSGSCTSTTANGCGLQLAQSRAPAGVSNRTVAPRRGGYVDRSPNLGPTSGDLFPEEIGVNT